MGQLTYQTIQVENRLPQSGGPSASGQAVAAGVKLLQKAMVALNGWAVAHRVNMEIKKHEPDIRNKLVRGGGVMVCVGIQEWERPDPTGAKAQSFLALHVVGGGTDPVLILRQYLAQPRLTQGAPKGWRRKDTYLWITEMQ